MIANTIFKDFVKKYGKKVALEIVGRIAQLKLERAKGKNTSDRQIH